MLSPEFLDNVATPAFETSIRRLIDLWTLKHDVSRQGTFSAYEDLRRTTLEAIWKILLGSNLGLNDASIQKVREKKVTDTRDIPSPTFPRFYEDFTLLLTTLHWVLTAFSPRLYKWIFGFYSPLRVARNRTRELFRGILENTRENIQQGRSNARSGLSDALRHHGSFNPDSDVFMVDEILELLITGHGTTATTIGWGLKYLADNQAVQTQLHSVLQAAFPDASNQQLPTGREITQAKIPYLDAVLEEILRMSFTGPILFRETLTDVEVMGYHIPAKTNIFLATQAPPNQYGMLGPNSFSRIPSPSPARVEGGRFPKSYFSIEKTNLIDLNETNNWNDNLHSFIPERWLTPSGEFDANAGLSLPFSAGKRGCFGKKLAMLELRLVFVMLVLRFRFEKLGSGESGYGSADGLTREPKCCFVRPVGRV